MYVWTLQKEETALLRDDQDWSAYKEIVLLYDEFNNFHLEDKVDFGAAGIDRLLATPTHSRRTQKKKNVHVGGNTKIC